MQLGLLNRYLEQQNTLAGVSPETQGKKLSSAATASDAPLPPSLELDSGDTGDYQPSYQTLLLTAIAEDFDISELPLDKINALQQRLNQFGLLTPNLHNAMRTLHQLRGDHSELTTNNSPDMPAATHINALRFVEYQQQQMQQKGADLSQRRQIGDLVRLFSNLESARSAIAGRL